MDLTERLARGPMLCDGGMGTQLMARGMRAGECSELWNVERTSEVEDVHRAYRDAGCELITTNTFGGTTTALARHGLAERAAELNELAVRLARRAVGGSCYLLGDIGPFGDFLEPMGTTTEAELAGIFRTQAMSLKRGGADGIIIETMSDPNEMRIAIKAAKGVAYWPVIATYAFNAPAEGSGVFRTMMGTTAEEAIQAAVAAGADVVGANCGTSLGLNDYLELAKVLVKAAGKTPVILQPNAGSPQTINGKTVHTATPEDMAALVQPLLAAGVRIIGGCCGTTPAHLKAMAARMRG
jgi:5-methyltetrahydrofolate--homocysteine methyltransferase